MNSLCRRTVPFLMLATVLGTGLAAAAAAPGEDAKILFDRGYLRRAASDNSSRLSVFLLHNSFKGRRSNESIA